MRALIFQAPNQMPLCDTESPIPGAHDVVVDVRAVGICGSDIHGFKGTTGRRKPPLIMGHEFSGIISAVGGSVTNYKIGDRVTAQPLLTCGKCENCRAGQPNICLNRGGLGITFDGAYAQSVRVPTKMLYHLPGELTWEQGALIEPLAVALHAVNRTPFALSDTIVILGGGAIGLLTLLAARLRGAHQIILTDRNANRLERARAWGADLTINVTQDNALEIILRETDGAGAHAVLDAVGTPASVELSLLAARPGGHITLIGNAEQRAEINIQSVVTRELTLHGTYGYNQEFAQALELLRDYKLDLAPLIDLTAPLADGPQIFHELAQGHIKPTKVILYP